MYVFGHLSVMKDFIHNCKVFVICGSLSPRQVITSVQKFEACEGPLYKNKYIMWNENIVTTSYENKAVEKWFKCVGQSSKTLNSAEME